MRYAAATVLALIVPLLACSPVEGPPTLTASAPTRTGILLAGDAVATPLVRALARDFAARQPGPAITVASPLGTRGGVRALDADRLSGALVVTVEEAPPRAGAFSLGRTRVVVAVGPGVRERTLTADALVDLFAGRQPAWSDKLPVRVLLGPVGDLPEAALSRRLPGLAEAITSARATHRWPAEGAADTRRSRLERTAGAVTIATEGNLRLEGTAAWMVELIQAPPTDVFLWLVPGPRAEPRLAQFGAFVSSAAARSTMTDFGFELTR